jgi:hypothetical protein
MAVSAGQRPRGCSTICLPFDKDRYPQVVAPPARFRQELDRFHRDLPELFPKDFAQGHVLKDDRTSAKLGLRLRRLGCKASGRAFTVRPSLALPYMTGYTDDAEGPLFLRSFGVPFWALAHVFGRGPMYWYRLELGLGRNGLVGTTVRRAELPRDLVADEHHRCRDGQKNYIATPVAQGCCLGAALAQSAGAAELEAAYAVFRQEAQDVEPGYAPARVNTDGWAATRSAWLALFPLVVALRCFLHGWLKVRERQAPQGGVRGVGGEGVGRLPRPEPAGLRAAAAPAVGVVAGARPGGLRVGAGAEATRPGQGVRRRVRPPRRAPDQRHAGPGDAVEEPVLYGRSTPARVGGGLRAARAGLGAGVQLPALGAGGGAPQRRLAQPGGALEPTPLPR